MLAGTARNGGDTEFRVDGPSLDGHKPIVVIPPLSSPQVIADFNAELPGGSADVVGQALARVEWEEKVRTFIGEKTDKICIVKEHRQQRRANQDYEVALDHMIQTLGIKGVMAFVPELRPPPLLSARTQRYFVAADDVADLYGGLLRSERPCLMELDTGVRRFELPRVLADGYPEPLMYLHITHDQGPVGWPALVNIYRDIGARGCLEADRLHIAWGAARSSMASAGLWVLVLSTTVCIKSKRAPFGEAGFLGTISECASHYFKTASSAGATFV